MRERLQEALREAAAEFLSREAGRQSLVTVTRAQLSENNKRVTIYLTVLPESAEEKALGFANRSRREFAEYFESRTRGAKTPHVLFVIDRGEKSRQRLDELTK
jgi:ribosome-binding factor A